MEGTDIYQIAKNCRTSVEMIEKFYASHIKNQLSAAAINIKRPQGTKQNRLKKKTPLRAHAGTPGQSVTLARIAADANRVDRTDRRPDRMRAQEKISAVEGIRMSREMKSTFSALDKKGASAEVRRSTIVRKYGK